MKFSLVVFVLLLTNISNCNAFEVKAEGPNAGDWSADLNVKLTKASSEISPSHVNCDSKTYKGVNSQPLHEMMSTSAVKQLCSTAKNDLLKGIFRNECCGKNCGINNKNYGTSNNPILAGTVFNDDPQSLMRRNNRHRLSDYLITYNYFENALNTTNTLTNSSHLGEMQFLHSMKSTNDKSYEDTREKIIQYATENILLAKTIDNQLLSGETQTLKTLLDTPISQDNFYSIFKDHRGNCPNKKMKDLFSCNDFQYGESANQRDFKKLNSDAQIRGQARTLGLLAMGSVLHLIQDSYSSSHTQRNAETGGIIRFYNYVDHESDFHIPDSHCSYDTISEENTAQIKAAQLASHSLLEMFSQLNCKTIDSQDQQVCRSNIRNWLSEKIFLKSDHTID